MTTALDKVKQALAPYPATVVPDGTALISAYETTDQA